MTFRKAMDSDRSPGYDGDWNVSSWARNSVFMSLGWDGETVRSAGGRILTADSYWNVYNDCCCGDLRPGDGLLGVDFTPEAEASLLFLASPGDDAGECLKRSALAFCSLMCRGESLVLLRLSFEAVMRAETTASSSGVMREIGRYVRLNMFSSPLCSRYYFLPALIVTMPGMLEPGVPDGLRRADSGLTVVAQYSIALSFCGDLPSAG